jgi:hypothetical protein
MFHLPTHLVWIKQWWPISRVHAWHPSLDIELWHETTASLASESRHAVNMLIFEAFVWLHTSVLTILFYQFCVCHPLLASSPYDLPYTVILRTVIFFFSTSAYHT